MKKIMMLLGVLVIAMFLVGCGTVTGEARGTGDIKVKPRGETEPTGEPVVPEGANCKIISVISSDYQWIWNSDITLSQVCAKEGMECRGAQQEQKEEYLDENQKVQSVNTISEWLSPYYCDHKMGTLHSSLGTNNPNDYSEPYAGPVRFGLIYKAVLCCS